MLGMWKGHGKRCEECGRMRVELWVHFALGVVAKGIWMGFRWSGKNCSCIKMLFYSEDPTAWIVTHTIYFHMLVFHCQIPCIDGRVCRERVGPCVH